MNQNYLVSILKIYFNIMTRIKDNGTKLILEQYETKVTLELPYSATNAAELLGLFKGSALAIGYTEEGWDNAVFDYCEARMDKDIDSIPEEFLDEAFAEHNAHEEGFDIDFDNNYKSEE